MARWKRERFLALGSVVALCGWGCSEKNSDASKTARHNAAAESTSAGKAEAAKAVVPVRLPGELVPAPWLGEATRVTALGQGSSAIVIAAGNGWLRWFSPSGEQLGERLGAGAPQRLRTIDIDGDGAKEVVFARGMGRGAADASVVLEVLRISGTTVSAELVPLPTTSRQQVAGVAGDGAGSLWVASFVSKFAVEVGRYEKTSDAWAKVEDRGQHRVVADLAVFDGVPVIARMYGETADEPGGVYALPSGKSPLVIPSTRGARALAVLPQETGLVMADGWHKSYARHAKGLVTLATRKSWGWTKKSSVEVAKNYGFGQLRVGNPHKHEGAEIVASGNGPAVVVLPTQPSIVYTLGDAIAVDAVPVNLTGDGRDEVVIAGPKPAIWNPR